MSIPDLEALARDPDPPRRAERERLRQLARRLREREATQLAATLEAALELYEASETPSSRLGSGRLQAMARSLLAQLARPLAALRRPQGATQHEADAQRRALAQSKAAPQREAAPPGPAAPPREAVPPAAKGDGRALGQILVELGHVTEAQIAQALELQRTKGMRTAECLLMLGAVSPEQLLAALQVQAGECPPEPEPERGPASGPSVLPAQRVTEGIFLGEVALGLELITAEQLEQAMHLHHHSGLRIGEALQKLGFLDQEGLAHALEMQRSLRAVARLAPEGGASSNGSGTRTS